MSTKINVQEMVDVTSKHRATQGILANQSAARYPPHARVGQLVEGGDLIHVHIQLEHPVPALLANVMKAMASCPLGPTA